MWVDTVSASTMFTDTDTKERIQEVSACFQYRFHSAFSANFNGDAEVQAMESNVVRGFEALVSDWSTCQMLERVKDRRRVQPINPFAKQSTWRHGTAFVACEQA
jgi:hypothetical protein